MKNAIVITNVDSLLKYALAYRFLELWNREEDGYNELRDKTEFRLCCRKNEGLEDLIKLGGTILPVDDYENKDFINRFVMTDVGYVIYIPENSENRVKEGEMVIKCAKEQGVNYITMFSHLGADRADKDICADKFHIIKEYYHLEKQVSRHFDNNSHCIIRSAMWHQFFFYFGPMIEDHNKIQLTIGKDRKWSSIDLADLVDATYNLSNDCEDESNSGFSNLAELYVSNLKKKNKVLFEFTAPYNITAEQLVEMASKGLERKDVTYERVHTDELYAYLNRIHKDNRFRYRPNQNAQDIYDHQTNIALAEDRPYTFPIGHYLNKQVIKFLIEFWELIEAGTDRTTKDLENALDHSSTSIKHFFEYNRDQFRRLR